MRLLNETTYPNHLFAMHLSKNKTSWLCKVGENIVTNHLQLAIVFNQQRLLRKRNLSRVPNGRSDDVYVDKRLAIERDILNGVILCRHILCVLTNVPFYHFCQYIKQSQNIGKFHKRTLHK